jgi:1,6-anhydro-N-acetylmuramate kinase
MQSRQHAPARRRLLILRGWGTGNDALREELTAEDPGWDEEVM